MSMSATRVRVSQTVSCFGFQFEKQGAAKPQAAKVIMIRGRWGVQLVAVVDSGGVIYSLREMAADNSVGIDAASFIANVQE